MSENVNCVHGDFSTIGSAAYSELYAASNNPISIVHENRYLNNSSHTLRISFRSGLTFEIPPCENYAKKEENTFSTYSHFQIPTWVKNNSHEQLSVDVLDDKLLKSFQQICITSPDYGKFSPVDFYYKMDFNLSLIQKAGGIAYLPEIDIIVSIKEMAEHRQHPYYRNELIKSSLSGLNPLFDNSLKIEIALIDNEGGYGRKWLRILGQVMELSPQKIPQIPSGIYLSKNGAVRRLNDEEFRQNGVFSSIEEAQSIEEVVVARREKLVDKETKLLDYKLETKKREADLSINKAIREDHYDQRAAERKDGSEVLKIIPAIVVGLGAVFMALKTFKLF